MMEISEIDLEKVLLDAGKKLLSPPSLVSELLDSLALVENFLGGVEQSPPESMREALVPSTKALISEELLRHPDADVKVAVASCISEITRITAPEVPYADDQMKEVFQLIVSCFENLDDKSSCSYTRRISILETLAKVRSCVVMLDLECDDLIVEMFRHFFRTIREDHHDGVFSSMETIMTLVLEESEDISVDLLSSILNVLKKENKEVLPIACQLGENVIVRCANQVKPYLLPAVRSSGASLDDYRKAVLDVCQAEDKVVEPTDGDVVNRNSADENDLVNASSEKAVEVGLETMEDAPPSEEVGPSTVVSPKTVMSNGILKMGNEDTPATNDCSMEAGYDTQDGKTELSKTIVECTADEEPPKSKIKPQKSNRRKGRKPNSTKSSLEPFEPLLSNRKMEVIDTPEHEENDAKDVDDLQSEDPAVDAAAVAHDEKSCEVPIPSPRTSDHAHVDISSPSAIGSLVDETRSKKTGRGKKKEQPIPENESASDVDSEKESDTKQDSEGATGLACTLNKSAVEKPSAASDQEESVPNCTDNTKTEYDNINELDGTSAKDLVLEAEVGGSHCSNKKKQGQAKATPAKGRTKTPAKDDKKKTVALPKSTPKATKDESGMEEALRSNSKRKRPSEEKVQKTKVYGPELVGAKVEVWWPDDKKFYKGVVKSFDAAEKEHKVFYDDGDVELLNLKNEIWKFVDESGGHASDGVSLDESADEMPKGKKAKTHADVGVKQGKTVSSTKMSGASSSKSKTTPKPGSTRKDDSKMAKKVGKSDVDKSGKSKASKSGNKLSGDTPKSAKNSKDDDDDDDTPKVSSKSKQDPFKGAAKPKGKSPKSVSISNPSSKGKVEVVTSTTDEETEDELLEQGRTLEKSKGKSESTPKSQKSSNKRKRSVKG